MQLINQVLRGILIGIANIIPGVSGGTMMVSMGIYDLLIHCITHLFSEFAKSIKTLLPYGIGMLIGIVALTSLLKFLFESYLLPTNTAFIGLILGGISPLLKKINRKDLGLSAVVIFLLFFALVILLAVAGDVANPESISLDFGTAMILLVMGAIAAATMIIPGVSGSMILMLLGYYTPVLNAIDALKNAVFHFDIAATVTPVLTLLPFGIGVLAGIFAVAKLIEWLLAHFPTLTYCAVLGLVAASPIGILLGTDLSTVTWVSIAMSLLTFVIGFIAASWLARESETAPQGTTVKK